MRLDLVALAIGLVLVISAFFLANLVLQIDFWVIGGILIVAFILANRGGYVGRHRL